MVEHRLSAGDDFAAVSDDFFLAVFLFRASFSMIFLAANKHEKTRKKINQFFVTLRVCSWLISFLNAFRQARRNRIYYSRTVGFARDVIADNGESENFAVCPLRVTGERTDESYRAGFRKNFALGISKSSAQSSVGGGNRQRTDKHT